MKIDVVDELHKVRRKHVNTPSWEIEKPAAEVLVKLKRGEESRHDDVFSERCIFCR